MNLYRIADTNVHYKIANVDVAQVPLKKEGPKTHHFPQLKVCDFAEEIPRGVLFSSIELACTVRQPGPCVRALCELVALLLSKNMTSARPRCNATSSNKIFTVHTALFTLRTSRFTLALHTPHFISSHIIWFLLTSCHLISALFISSHPFSHVI